MKRLEFSVSARILVLAPHPDDESIWCGGLLLQYSDQCDVVVLTDGRHGGTDGADEEEIIAIRKAELSEAMVYAGVKNFQFIGIEDGALNKAGEKFSRLNVSGYDAIFCPAPTDTHPDHACVWEFLRPMIKKVQQVFFYDGWSALVNPTHHLDISQVVERKKKLIAFHGSQVSQVDYVAKMTGLNCYRGLLAYPAVEYAEAYQEM